MRDLSAIAEQLRNVQKARRRFLQLWAVEAAVIHPGLDRVAQALDGAHGSQGFATPQSALDALPPSADEG